MSRKSSESDGKEESVLTTALSNGSNNPAPLRKKGPQMPVAIVSDTESVSADGNSEDLPIPTSKETEIKPVAIVFRSSDTYSVSEDDNSEESSIPTESSSKWTTKEKVIVSALALIAVAGIAVAITGIIFGFIPAIAAIAIGAAAGLALTGGVGGFAAHKAGLFASCFGGKDSASVPLLDSGDDANYQAANASVVTT